MRTILLVLCLGMPVGVVGMLCEDSVTECEPPLQCCALANGGFSCCTGVSSQSGPEIKIDENQNMRVVLDVARDLILDIGGIDSIEVSKIRANAMADTTVAIDALRTELKELIREEVKKALDEAKQYTDAPKDEVSFTDGTKLTSGENHYLLPPNLISNGFMKRLTNDVPDGWGTFVYDNGDDPSAPSTTIEIKAVSPFEKCFEGPYLEFKPSNAAATCDEATSSNPYWFRRYWKGARVQRGGLADGWGSNAGGHILRVTGNRKSPTHFPTVQMDKVHLVVTDEVNFRCWIKIVKGRGAYIGGSYSNSVTVSKEEAEAAEDGWLFVDRLIRTSHIANIDMVHAFNIIPMGTESDFTGEFEIYVALPYLANVEHDDSPNWMPSVADMVYDGVTTTSLSFSDGTNMNTANAAP